MERNGLFGAPDVPVVVGEEAHVTIHAALQMLGMGRDRVARVPTDGQGRMRADALAEALAGLDRPALVCAQAGNVNTGAFDPLPRDHRPRPRQRRLAPRGRRLRPVGLGRPGAPAPPGRASGGRTPGPPTPTSGSTCRTTRGWCSPPTRRRTTAAMTLGAAYYVETDGRRARPVQLGGRIVAARPRVRGLGGASARSGATGVAEMVGRHCDLARRFAAGLDDAPGLGIRVLNDVVLNQVLVRFEDPSGDAAAGDARTSAVIAAVQADGTLWLGGSTWHGQRVMRISVSGWRHDRRRRRPLARGDPADRGRGRARRLRRSGRRSQRPCPPPPDGRAGPVSWRS